MRNEKAKMEEFGKRTREKKRMKERKRTKKGREQKKKPKKIIPAKKVAQKSHNLPLFEIVINKGVC